MSYELWIVASCIWTTAEVCQVMTASTGNVADTLLNAKTEPNHFFKEYIYKFNKWYIFI